MDATQERRGLLGDHDRGAMLADERRSTLVTSTSTSTY
jgi:hypothetical protein